MTLSIGNPFTSAFFTIVLLTVFQVEAVEQILMFSDPMDWKLMVTQ
jgi:hypothetical protein